MIPYNQSHKGDFSTNKCSFSPKNTAPRPPSHKWIPKLRYLRSTLISFMFQKLEEPSPHFLCSQMYFEPQTWFRKVNFQQHPDEAVVVEAAGRRVTATMLVRPKATIDVIVDPM